MSATILRFPIERAGRTAKIAHLPVMSPAAFMYWPLLIGTALGAAAVAAAAERALLVSTTKHD